MFLAHLFVKTRVLRSMYVAYVSRKASVFFLDLHLSAQVPVAIIF